MLEVDRLEDGDESPPIAGVSERGVRSERGRYVTLFLGCLVVALVVVVVVMVFSPPTDEPRQIGESAAPESPPSPSPSPESPAEGKKVRVSTVRLPTAGIAASSEQLQQEAERAVGRLRELYPELPAALHVAAMLNAQLRRSEDAEKLWQRCIELDPSEAAYYINLAAIAMDRGDSQLAADTLRKAIEAGCASPDVYHHLAVALTKLGRCEEAEETIQKALSDYPQSAGYWLVLGQAQLKLGKAAEAEASLRRAIELGSAAPSAYFALANACARLDKQEDAAKYREIFSKMKAETPMDKQQRFRILSTAESRRTAVTILCEAAAVHRQQQNSMESERLLHRAIALDPTSPVPCHSLAELYQDAGMFAEAKVVCERLVEIEPLQFLNYLNLAQSCAQLGERESAEAALKLGVAMCPEAIEGYAVLARFYMEGGNAGKARWFAQEAIRRSPSAEGYEFLASVCRMMGDDPAADAAHANALKLSPEAIAAQEKSGKKP